MKADPKTYLIVCTGNTCRSPMGEAILKARLGPNSGCIIESAGLFAGEGLPASPEAVHVLRELGIDLRSHRSRQLTLEQAERAERILVMTASHRAHLLAQWPHLEPKVFLINSFGFEKIPQDISDPIGGSIDAYRRARDQIDEAVSNLVLYMSDRGDFVPPPSQKEKE